MYWKEQLDLVSLLPNDGIANGIVLEDAVVTVVEGEEGWEGCWSPPLLSHLGKYYLLEKPYCPKLVEDSQGQHYVVVGLVDFDLLLCFVVELILVVVGSSNVVVVGSIVLFREWIELQ